MNPYRTWVLNPSAFFYTMQKHHRQHYHKKLSEGRMTEFNSFISDPPDKPLLPNTCYNKGVMCILRAVNKNIP